MIKKMLDGNGAASEAIKLAEVSVISAYPITPQSPISEKLSEMVENRELDAKYIRVESEHSALSCAIGAQLSGVRACTATASVGLALMFEVLGVASGCRVPLVMPVVNRALVSPWSLWCDHQDSMAARDSGWMQFYLENAQEVFDFMLIAYRVAEDSEVMLPAMVCLDGFFLSHSMQTVSTLSPEEVKSFLPEYKAKNMFFDFDNPMIINNLTPPEEFSEMRLQQEIGFDNALNLLPEILEEYNKLYTKKYDIVENYRCDDADAVIVAMGSMTGTIKHVVNEMRKIGKKVGLLKIILFRPFPFERISSEINSSCKIGIIDRSGGLGAQQGPVFMEVNAALSGRENIYGYIAGLGGRDVTEKTIEGIFTELLDNPDYREKEWIDTDDNVFELRKKTVVMK